MGRPGKNGRRSASARRAGAGAPLPTATTNRFTPGSLPGASVLALLADQLPLLAADQLVGAVGLHRVAPGTAVHDLALAVGGVDRVVAGAALEAVHAAA